MSNLPSPLRAWSSVEEQAVAAMLIDGMSAGMIAGYVGLTRNAVIGRIFRNPALHKHVKHVAKHPKPPPRFKKPKEVKVIISKAPPVEPPMQPMPLIDTGSRYCKWPVEDAVGVVGGILCCGRLVNFGEVYCRQHLKAARPPGRPE